MSGKWRESLGNPTYVSNKFLVTIDEPLILKVRGTVYFFAGKAYNRPFRGVFRHIKSKKNQNPTAIRESLMKNTLS